MRKLLLLALLASGCKWTEFDDLESEMWVESTEKPDSNSSDWAVALTSSLHASDDGGEITVLGAGNALFTEYQYPAGGGAKFQSATEQKLNNQFGIGNLDPDPILISDPASDEVALVSNSGGNGSIAILSGTHGLMSSQVFGPTTPDAAIYFKAASQAATEKPSRVFVGSDDSVYGFAAAPATQPKCQLVDMAGQPIKVRGMAAVRLPAAADDDLAVLGGDGKVYFYAGAAAFDAGAACSPSLAPLFPAVDLGFAAPARNAKLFTVGTSKWLVVGAYADSGSAKGVIAVVDLSGAAPALVGTPLGRDNLKSLAFLDVPDGHQYVLGGFPTDEFDGTVAGQVFAFPFDNTTGVIDPTPAMTLHDAQPSGNQLFGRALAVVPFNGKPAIVVGAASEVFFYYNATPLYDELRRR